MSVWGQKQSFSAAKLKIRFELRLPFGQGPKSPASQPLALTSPNDGFQENGIAIERPRRRRKVVVRF